MMEPDDPGTVPPDWQTSSAFRAPGQNERPQFQWRSDSTEPGIKSGWAIWRHVSGVDNRTEMVIRVRFESFAGAHDVCGLISEAWAAGRRAGLESMADAVTYAMQKEKTRT
jgi:hypothetical protein